MKTPLLLLSLFMIGFGFTPAATAQSLPPGTPTFQQLKSFGTRSSGGFPYAELMQGTDGALYGTAAEGGRGYGTVFKVNPDGSAFTVLHYFDSATSGKNPQGRLVLGADGMIYGTAREGGSSGYGTVFKLNPDGTGFTVLLSSVTMAYPVSGLIRGVGGVLYGTSAGTVFKLNPDGTGFTVLKTLNHTQGSSLLAGVIQGADGALYGTAFHGGTNDRGTIFKLNPNGTGFTVLMHFEGTGTRNPYGELMQGMDGALYGTTFQGGIYDYGTVFKINPDGTGFSVLKELDYYSTGGFPRAGLIQAADGALYGTATGNNPRVFKLNPDGSGFTVLKDLNYTEGAYLQAGIIQGTDGALYGAAIQGGSHSGGTVFRLNTNGTGFTVLKHLQVGSDIAVSGGYPDAELMQGSDGSFYGIAPSGGSYGAGTAFKLNADGIGYTVLLNFEYSSTGAYPLGALIQGTDGALYGTTYQGGSGGYGTVFRMNPDGSGFTVLFENFDYYTIGGYPRTGLTRGPDGALYGTASYGGVGGAGTVFKLNTDGTGFTILKHLNYSTGGTSGVSEMMWGADGKLYGTTSDGGENGVGTVFRLNADGADFTVLKSLGLSTTGGNPYGKLVQGTDGALYGTTAIGGYAGGGTVFKVDTDGSTFTVLQSFNLSSTGANPQGGLIQGTDGALYGTAPNGGSSDHGTVFTLNPDGTGFAVLQDLAALTTGSQPLAGLLQGADQALYGTTYRGGDSNGGTIFRLTLSLSLTPSSIPSGSGDFTLTVLGCFFADGAVVQWNGAALETAFISSSELTAAVPTLPATSDIYTALVTVKNPDGAISSPAVFHVIAPHVAQVKSTVAAFGESAVVSTAPIDIGNTSGITGTLVNSGDPSLVTASAAIYNNNPSPVAIDSLAGEFMTLRVQGADEADSLDASFYYPVDAPESVSSPALKYFNGSEWAPVLTSGGSAPGKSTTDNLDGTISGGRFTVRFDSTSTPKITELGGVYFVMTSLPLAPIPAYYQQIRSFGAPAPGGYPYAGLIQGTDGALYGTAYFGGTKNFGTVFKIKPDGTEFTVLVSFDSSTTGGNPQAGVIQGADGALYGATLYGGNSNLGTLFKLNTDGSGFTVLLHFDGSTTGGNPQAGLLRGAGGELYGTASQGGSDGGGTLFRLNADGSGFTILLNLDAAVTGSPQARLIQGADGALYGTTAYGGTFSWGTVFKVNPNGTDFTVLHNIQSSYSNAGLPIQAGVIQGSDGLLYGTQPGGGASGNGIVFRMTTEGTGFTILKEFDDFTTGRSLYGELLEGVDGVFYGTAYIGGHGGSGTVFRLSSDGNDFEVIHDFDGSASAALHGLVQGADGALYGTGLVGGRYGWGTVFKLNTNGSGLTVLKNLSFDVGPDPDSGIYPQAGLMQGTDGALYGTASGAVFKLGLNGTGYTVLQSGTGATSRLIQGTNGALYGTAADGGSNGYGTVFKLNPDGTGFAVLQNFDSSDGYGISTTGGFPYVGVSQGTDGALYGTTSHGGANALGTLFKLNPDGTEFIVLHDFDVLNPGSPYSGLVQGSDGMLYGHTDSLFHYMWGLPGGSDPTGTVFKLNTDGTDFTIVQPFFNYPTTGGQPKGTLIRGTNGDLYGTASEGGSRTSIDGIGYGTVFKLNPDGTGSAVLLNFDYYTTGAYPQAGLVQATDGQLYGTTSQGGSIGYGTVFRLNPDGTGLTILLNFDNDETGASPSALVQATDGNLYGTTRQGGDFNAGTAFRIVLNSLRISSLTPPWVPSGTGAFALTVDGSSFSPGAVVQRDGQDLQTTFVSSSRLTAAVLTTPVTNDISTALITVRNPDGTTATPVVFLVAAANVADAESTVATSGQSGSVSTAPVEGGGHTAGITATVANSGDANPVAITAAIYNTNPSPNPAFEIGSATGVAGEFLDLQVTGADPADTMVAYFYYPPGTIESEESPTLKYFDGVDWVNVVSSGGVALRRNLLDNLDGTVSGGRLEVRFDSTSTPKITELGGTFFAMTVQRPPLAFTGFLTPIGGADASGGSFTQPLRTFKANSTIPVKFTASRDGTPIVTGVHTLQATKYSSETTADTPIDATPQGSATTGNRFELHGSQWHFNLDTKATGLTKGVWQFVATLSDGSQHSVWVQIK